MVRGPLLEVAMVVLVREGGAKSGGGVLLWCVRVMGKKTRGGQCIGRSINQCIAGSTVDWQSRARKAAAPL